MPISEARKRANQKWDQDNLVRISCAVKKERIEEIRAAAAAENKSMNKFICDCIEEHMKARERENVE